MRRFLLLLLLTASSCARVDVSPKVLRVVDKYMSDCDFSLHSTTARYPIFPAIVDENMRGISIVVDSSKQYRVGISTDTIPKEMAYDHFEFEKYVYVALDKGHNALPGELTGIKAFGFVTEEGLQDESVVVEIERSEAIEDVVLKAPKGAAFTKHPYTEWHYANGATLAGLLYLAETIGKPKAINHIVQQCDFTLDNIPLFESSYNSGRIRAQNYRLFRSAMLDDTGAAALPYIEMALRGYKHQRLLPLLDKIAHFIMCGQYRLEDGTFIRPEPKWTVWCDDMFMACSFLVRYFLLTGEKQYIEECVDQAEKFYHLLDDPTSGLLYHAYNQEHIGAKWGRANGWYLWALTDILMQLDSTTEAYSRLLSIYVQLVSSICQYQAESGLWHQVVDEPDTYEESSCSCIFTFAIARGIRLKWIDESYIPIVRSAWDGIKSKITDDGRLLGICRSMSIQKDIYGYNERETAANDPRGLGAFFMAAAETALINIY